MTLLVLNALLVFPLFPDRPRVSLAVESHDGIFFYLWVFFFLFFCSVSGNLSQMLSLQRFSAT